MESILHGPFGPILLKDKSITIGRFADAQAILSNDPQVSGHHVEIRPVAQGYVIIDLGSTNGTFVNERRLAPHVARLLFPGDRIRIGQTVFSYAVNPPQQIEPTRQPPQWPSQHPLPHPQWRQQLLPPYQPPLLGIMPAIPPQPMQWHPPAQAPYYQRPPYYQPLMQPMIFNQSFQPVSYVNMNTPQHGCLLRLIYFMFIGSWLGILWAFIALFLIVLIVTAPVGFVMLNQLPAVMTLQRH